MKGYLHKIGKVWYTTVDLPKLPGAKRRQKEIKLGALSKSDAQAKEREVLREIGNHPLFELANVTVEQLLSSWLSHMAPTATSQPISPKTYERYASIVRNQLIPNLGIVSACKGQSADHYGNADKAKATRVKRYDVLARSSRASHGTELRSQDSEGPKS